MLTPTSLSRPSFSTTAKLLTHQTRTQPSHCNSILNSIPVSSCLNLYESRRHLTKTQKKEIKRNNPRYWTRPVNTHPETFPQTVILSDGSSVTLSTTTPKASIKLTKDTRNSPLWNPSLTKIKEASGELSRFEKRFGDLGSLNDLSKSIPMMGQFVSGEILVKEKKAPEPVLEVSKKGKKKK